MPAPVACCPSALTKQQREQSRALRSALATGILERTELPNGYAFELRPDDELFRTAAEWVTLERRCCPFLTFDLHWDANGLPLLSLTGPESTKAFLAAEMPELPVEPGA